MAINILDMIKSQVGSQITGQVAQKFGVDDTTAKMGIDALLPSILGGVVSKVSTPSGADQLDRAITDGGYDGGLLDNISGMFTGDQVDKLADQGGGLVSMIFGDKAAILGPIIAKLTGMNSGSVMSMLAMLAPLVMSFIGKQKAASGLSSSGLATMLMSQKDNIAAAMPRGVSEAMGLGLMTPTASVTRAPAASKVTAAPAKSSGGGFGIAKVLIPLAILAAVAYGCYSYIFGGMRPTGAEGNVVVAFDPAAFPDGNFDSWASSAEATQAATTPAAEPAVAAESSIALPPADAPPTESVAKPTMKLPDLDDAAKGLAAAEGVPSFDTAGLTKSLESLTGTLGTVSDVESAKAALPQLKDMETTLETATQGFASLPEGERDMASKAFKTVSPELQAQIKKVLAIPGVSDVLKPVMDSIVAKLRPLNS